MNEKPSGHSCLAPLLALACAFTLALSFAAYAAEVNNGRVEYINPGKLHIASGGYINHGDLTATFTEVGGTALLVGSSGFDNHGIVNAIGFLGGGIGITGGGFTNYISGNVTASAHDTGTFGIYVYDGGFANYGSVSGNGENSGIGISVASGGFANYRHATVTATGITAGTGIHVENGGFTNNGTVFGNGGDGGIGIHVVSGGFTNHGNAIASGDSSGGIGMRIENGGFDNSGLLTLLGSGTSISMVDISGNDMRLLPGSNLAFGDGHIDMGGTSTSLIVQPGAKVFSLAAAAGGSDTKLRSKGF